MTLTVGPIDPDYPEVRIITCECGHISVHDVAQLQERAWMHACPGCHLVERVPRSTETKRDLCGSEQDDEGTYRERTDREQREERE